MEASSAVEKDILSRLSHLAQAIETTAPVALSAKATRKTEKAREEACASIISLAVLHNEPSVALEQRLKSWNDTCLTLCSSAETLLKTRPTALSFISIYFGFLCKYSPVSPSSEDFPVHKEIVAAVDSIAKSAEKIENERFASRQAEISATIASIGGKRPTKPSFTLGTMNPPPRKDFH
jgi:hypothetical protein